MLGRFSPFFSFSFGLRLIVLLFVVPILARYVPNLDPLLWIALAFGFIFVYQHLTDVTHSTPSSGNGSRDFGSGTASGQKRLHAD